MNQAKNSRRVAESKIIGCPKECLIQTTSKLNIAKGYGEFVLKTVGFPRMAITPGFRREYPPWFVKKIARLVNHEVLIAEGYGSDQSYSLDDYSAENVKIVTQEEVYSSSDIVVCLTAPSESEWKHLKRGQTLVSFLHYDTHPTRTLHFFQQGVNTISLDSLKDDRNLRLVEDLRGTAYNSVRAAILELRKQVGEDKWFDPDRKPFHFVVIGAGTVGIWAVQALTRMGNIGLKEELIQRGGNPKTIVTPLEIYETKDEKFMNEEILPNTDILVDATFRLKSGSSKHIISAKQIELLPEHAIICDAAADRYDVESDPRIVKGIQGIPTGTVDHYVFYPDDSEWEDPEFVPEQYQLTKEQRRTTVSSYSWPSYGSQKDRAISMEHYARQIYPFVEFLVKNGVEGVKQPKGEPTSLVNDAIYYALNPFVIGKPFSPKEKIPVR